MHSMAVLGATGSIGTQALSLISAHPDQFRADVLTARSSAGALFELVRQYRPKAAGLVVEPKEMPDDVKHGCEWYFGEDCSERALLAARPEYALCAMVGIAGLPAVMTALGVCSRVLLANKEALVTGGELVTRRAGETKALLLPVDSEHSAIFQCLMGAGGNRPRRLILTASGGPFRKWNKEAMQNASIEDALGHPTWNMGGKITIDCATMMNKGLELIEAHHLFEVPMEQIEVLVHPESIVHSMVEFEDGALLAQLGMPDMRGAIGFAMGYPERLPYDGRRLDLAQLGKLSFEPPDERRFPCLRYARQAQRAGGVMPVALNGSNEVAVGAFLDGLIRFGQIAEVVDYVLQSAPAGPILSIDDVLHADRQVRVLAEERIKGLSPKRV